MSPTFHSLSIRNYRIWFLGGLVSNIGTWAGRVGQDWLVLTELTDHSSTALGTVTGLQFLPILLLAPWPGPSPTATTSDALSCSRRRGFC